MADQAASLATGQGLTSMEDAARAAASGVRGSATAQADAALQARLNGQLSALAGMPLTSTQAGGLSTPPEVPAADGPPVVMPSAGVGPSVVVPGVGVEPPTPGPGTSAGAPVADQRGASGVDTAPPAPPSGEARTTPTESATTIAARAGDTNAPLPAGGVEHAGAHSLATSSALPESALSPTLSSAATAAPVLGAGGVPTAVDGQTVNAGNAAGGAGSGNAANSAASWHTSASTAPASGPSVGPGAPTVGPPPALSLPEPRTAASVPGAGHVPPAAPAAPAAERGAAGTVPAPPQPPTLPTPDAAAPGRDPRVRPDTSVTVGADGSAGPRFRTPEWYAEQWALDREAFERRRYRGYYESQRAWFEDKRRFDEAARLRARADEHHQVARDFAAHALHLHRTGQARQADGWQRAANDEMRAYGQHLDYAEAVLAGGVVPSVVGVVDPADFRRINDDVGDLAYGAVETVDRSALTGDDYP
ncbi:hypothetical protein AB0F80_29330, partial [Micromonospora echinofusca]